MARSCCLLGAALVALVLVQACAAYPNPITDDEYVSVVTSSMDPAFYKYATEVNTDKTWDHSYQYIYSKYLANVRREPMRLLEIGLGCNMGYGAGHSLAVRSTTWILLYSVSGACPSCMLRLTGHQLHPGTSTRSDGGNEPGVLLRKAAVKMLFKDTFLESRVTRCVRKLQYESVLESRLSYPESVGTTSAWSDLPETFLYTECFRLIESFVCKQLWKKYLPNTKVSFVEYDAACATKHKAEIEATAGGTLYIGALLPILPQASSS